MKNRLLCQLAVLFVTISIDFIFCAQFFDNSLQLEQKLICDNKPTQALLTLLQKCDIKHDSTLANIVEQTQKEWLRAFGVERFHIPDTFSDRKSELYPLFNQLGLINVCMPMRSHYNYCLVHGSTTVDVRARLAFAIMLWNQGIRFDKLIFLTGARGLDPIKETTVEIEGYNQRILPLRSHWKLDENSIPLTEAAMMKIVYNQTEFPKDFAQVPLTIIDAPKQKMADGTMRRPNTYDTIALWLAQKPQPGTCLAISKQQYVGYQHAVIRSQIPDHFEVETVGPSPEGEDDSVTICLDSLARWLYQERNYLTKETGCNTHDKN